MILCWLVGWQWSEAALAPELWSSQISDTVKILSQAIFGVLGCDNTSLTLSCGVTWATILESAHLTMSFTWPWSFVLNTQNVHIVCLSYIRVGFSWWFLWTEQHRQWKISSTPTFMSFYNESLFVSLQKWWKILILTHRISGLPSLPFQDRWDGAYLVYLVEELWLEGCSIAQRSRSPSEWSSLSAHRSRTPCSWTRWKSNKRRTPRFLTPLRRTTKQHFLPSPPLGQRQMEAGSLVGHPTTLLTATRTCCQFPPQASWQQVSWSLSSCSPQVKALCTYQYLFTDCPWNPRQEKKKKCFSSC